MKWINKGSEYESLGMQFKDRQIAIYGAGIIGQELLKKLSFLNSPILFIDKNEDLQYRGVCGHRVYSIKEFAKLNKDKYLVIIALDGYNGMVVHSQLNHLGYIEGINCFKYDVFVNYYLPIYALYVENTLYFPSISFLLTTKCNLNCIGCLNFTKFNQNKHHYDIASLKENVDAFFRVVDYVDKFHMSGGEPFLYPYYVELIDYVGSNYSSKIGDIYTATNGTVMPDLRLCEKFREYNVFVEIDDYRDTLSPSLLKNDRIITLFENYGIRYSDRSANYWIDLDPENQDNSHLNQDDMAIWYDTCNNPFASIHNGKLYSCNYDDYAKEANIVEENDEDYIDFMSSEIPDKKIVLEFRMGYTSRGYVNFCCKCAGHEMTNLKHIRVAEQWKNNDICNCTSL